MKRFLEDNFITNLIFNTLIIFIIEVLFKALNNFNIFSYSTLRIFFSSLIFGIIITFISNLFKKRKVRTIVTLIFIFLYTVYCWLQLGFINFLGVYISFHTSNQFGAVVDYIKDYLTTFKWTYHLIYIPFILSILYYIYLKKKDTYSKINFNKKYFILLGVFVLSFVSYYLTLKLDFMQNKFQTKSNLALIKNPSVPTIAVHEFGPVVFGLVDLKTMIFPVTESVDVSKNTHETKPVVKREVSPVLDNLSKEDSSKYSKLNTYFANQEVTDYNDYTGMFKGKNVIVILMESVNNGIINEELFPNFYKMYSSGWHWTNNYSPRNSCATGNNEFSLMTGLYSIYNTCTSNTYKNNTYFESIFGLFNDAGYTTRSYHDYTEWYYYRNTIHSNMGSGQFLDIDDLNMTIKGVYGEWPSDEVFFTNALDNLLNTDYNSPFMAFFTTVTTHQPYIKSSYYGDLYKEEYEKMGYSTPVSRYFSKMKVLDNALGILLDNLEEKQVLEDTVIVLTADHYPYGLKDDYLSEFLDGEFDDYEAERTPFVIYNPSIKSEEYTEYTSYINIVPTLANLMGIEYDPRLYMGTDLFSDTYQSRVVFADGSWKNELAYYNASTSTIKYFTDKEYTVDEVNKVNTKITDKLTISTSAIKMNYFNYLEEKIKEYNDSLQNEE